MTCEARIISLMRAGGGGRFPGEKIGRGSRVHHRIGNQVKLSLISACGTNLIHYPSGYSAGENKTV
jgi:hypothetical protein